MDTTRRAALVAQARTLGRQLANELLSDGDAEMLAAERAEVQAEIDALDAAAKAGV